MTPRIVVVDYHKGNLRSVERGLAAAGGQAFVSDDATHIAHADAIVLPGVGSFADASASLHALGQREVIKERIAAGVPFLGICLGMHLMFEEGVEGVLPAAVTAGGKGGIEHTENASGSCGVDEKSSACTAPGLAVFPGRVQALPRFDTQGKKYKIPHVGWNAIFPTSEGESGRSRGHNSTSEPATKQEQGFFRSPLLAGIEPGEFFYFIHSFAVPDSAATLASAEHSTTFPCVVSNGKAAFGVQFHPEKSSDAGAMLLGNFVQIVKEG